MPDIVCPHYYINQPTTPLQTLHGDRYKTLLTVKLQPIATLTLSILQALSRSRRSCGDVWLLHEFGTVYTLHKEMFAHLA